MTYSKNRDMKIRAVRAIEIIDSRATPTIKAEVVLEDGSVGRAMVPSGASVGKNEAKETRDGTNSKRWMGKGVTKAVHTVNDIIAPKIKNEIADVKTVDGVLLELDGTKDKSKLGANSILSVSLANARAIARSRRISLFSFIAEISGTKDISLPTPMVNIISGGLHAGKNIELQDFLAIPFGAQGFREAMDQIGSIYHITKSLLAERGFSTLLADEGGFGPNISNNENALELLSKAIDKAGLENQVGIGIDAASSHFWFNGEYVLSSQNVTLDGEGMVDLLEGWTQKYRILSIEDGCSEEDWASWVLLTKRLGKKVQLIGDDLFTTSPSLIRRGITEGIANSVLIKLNQIGTLSETLEAIDICKKSNYAPVVSARSGDTEDPFIADLAVGTAAGQIKIGSIARSERTSKYNRLLQIEAWSKLKTSYAGSSPFRNLDNALIRPAGSK